MTDLRMKIGRGQIGRRLLAAALLLGLAAPGCGSGGAQTAVKVVVDGKNLTPASQAMVRAIWLFVTGDGESGTRSQLYSTTGLPGGQYIAIYRPHVTTGTLDITVTLNDAGGNVLGTRMTKAFVRLGNEVVALVSFGDGDLDGGVSPPPLDGGDAAVGDGALDAPMDKPVGDGATPDLPAPDGSGSDGAPADGASADGQVACNAQACSGTTANACCPSACTALTDIDCAGCGNGKIDPGETCDPTSACKTACPQVACQLFTLMGSGTCQAACVASGMQTMCVNGDGCCPAGCTTASDTDCSATCGNGLMEGTELCDGNCPSKCPPMGCQQRTLQGSETTCNAQCVNGAMQTACANGDGCCPTGCDATSDTDCAVTCGNGKLDAGETCDGNCPTSCPAMGCTLRILLGTPSACNVTCINAPSPQMACVNGDACCPAGCNNTNDNNCTPMCGNSVVEMGETCDPQSACTTVMTGCVSNANTVVTTTGAPAQCTFVCTRAQRACGPADTFCPNNVTCGPTMDADCPGCGNSRLETGETCDPPSMCMTQMTACTSDANNVRVSSGTVAACTYRCTTTARTCGPADGFCPTSVTCGPTMDIDCAGCGNGKIETALGENCDVAPAATTCASMTCNDSNPCTDDVRTVDPTNACKVTCTNPPRMTCNATVSDMCCPGNGTGTCNATNDIDCRAVCGNSVVEGGETCDPATACAAIVCPTPPVCRMAVRNGSNTMCNVICTTADITTCSMGTRDGCCPGGGRGDCNATNDVDCTAVCGNGVLEAGETCETSGVPTAQLCANFRCNDNNVCTNDVVTGSTTTCNPRCAPVTITTCSGATRDGCCPPGPPTSCNANTDSDCGAVCGNGVLESGETCETGIAGSCPTPTSCPAMVGCTTQQIVGGGTCLATCTPTGTQSLCVNNDGCCPGSCNETSDSDCAPRNETCASAIDISPGGDFKFNLTRAKKDIDPGCTADVNSTFDIFYTFKLDSRSSVYLDVYESGGAAVNAAIELYFGGCPGSPSSPKIVGCSATSGQDECTKGVGSPWPRIFQPDMPVGTYVVVVRAAGTPNGTHTLRFQRVPTTCVAGGPLAQGTIQGNTCTKLNQYAPSCAPPTNTDLSYYVQKCPDVGVSVTTCGGETGRNDTVLLLGTGSFDVVGQGSCVPAQSGAFLECNDDFPTSASSVCANTPKASYMTNGAKTARGIVTVTVDSVPIVGASSCGAFSLTAAIQ